MNDHTSRNIIKSRNRQIEQSRRKLNMEYSKRCSNGFTHASYSGHEATYEE